MQEHYCEGGSQKLLELGRVTRENYNIYGTALELVARCKCSNSKVSLITGYVQIESASKAL